MLLLPQRLYIPQQIFIPIIWTSFQCSIVSVFEKNSHEIFTFVSVPLLYEVHWGYLFDKVIVVAANDEIRKQRLIERRNLTKEDAIKRMQTQITQEEKIKFADFVIYNNTNYIDLNRQITEVLTQLI